MGVQEAEKLKQICSVIHQTVDTEKIYLFGSYAYGVPTQNSDFLTSASLSRTTTSARPTRSNKKIRRALYPVQDMPPDCSSSIAARILPTVSRQRLWNAKSHGAGVLLYA